MTINCHDLFYRFLMGCAYALLVASLFAMMLGTSLVLRAGVDRSDVAALLSLSFAFGGFMATMIASVDAIIGANYFTSGKGLPKSEYIGVRIVALVVTLAIAAVALNQWLAIS